MKLDPPKNKNYAAQVVRVPRLVKLEGLDNLDGVPVLGHQALTQKGKSEGDLVIAFTAETQLSHEFAAFNNLYRSEELNNDKTERGYLEANRRIRAIKLRGHRSDALIMPLSSVEFATKDWLDLEEGDTFDTINGHEICCKYEIPVKRSSTSAQSKIAKAFKRVDEKIFPRHLETDQYWRSKHGLDPRREVVITQKLHGCLWRGGRVPVLRKLTWWERIAKRFGARVDEYEYDVVFGSNRVIKDANNPDQQHFYSSDIWTDYGKRVADLIPEGVILYGELIGWTPDGVPIQKNYTYHLPKGECELYVYRVATINAQGTLADLSWDGVKEFCANRGLKWVPELYRDIPEFIESEVIEPYLDTAFWLDPDGWWDEAPVPLSDKKTVDEGFCLRQEGIVPLILKAKAPLFLIHESKILDTGESDIESAA